LPRITSSYSGPIGRFAILAARRLLLQQPSRLESYSLETETGDSEQRDLPSLKRPDNLDYVVADGGALPVPSARASCVAALNVVCAVPQPHQLLSELSRVAATGALLLFSSPYWGEAQGGSPHADLALKNPGQTRAALLPGFEILVEHEMVPWTIRLARRRWNVYLCHCLVARRR
jgi:SAM-dependent methyltransferase